MDLSEGTDAVQQTCSDDVEDVEEAEPSVVGCSDCSVTPAPASFDTTSQPEMISMPSDCSHKTFDTPLISSDEIGDVLVSSDSVSDLQLAEVETDQIVSGQVETDREDSQPELLLKLAETDTVGDSEEFSQFSGGFVEDDNQRSVPPFFEHSEERGDDSSGLVQQATEEESLGVRDSGEESQQLSLELGSRSQSPMSYVVQLNEDSECSLQSLPPGEHGPTNFSMKLSGLVSADESYLTNVGDVTSAEYLEDDSRCSQFSERMNDEPDLLMEVETGSTMSEAVSVKDSSTTLDPSITKETSTASRKSTSRSEDRNKSRIRKRLMVESAPAETEDGFVT